jgi:hypothetical protein
MPLVTVRLRRNHKRCVFRLRLGTGRREAEQKHAKRGNGRESDLHD